MKPNNVPTPTPKMTPEMLLTGLESQVRSQSYENAVGASAHFVEQLIASGKIQAIDVAVKELEKGVDLLQPIFQKRQLEIKMKELEAYLPKPEVEVKA